ncbi:MAG TPA: TlpA disulfide reductase family protein [Bacteroidia bacterium]|nr:TlpA disulfide reductase family protein [Bacteroidia bacterium]
MNKKTTGYLLIMLAMAIVIFQYVKYRVAPSFEIQNLQLTTADGNNYPVQFKENKLLVVSFFTTWCGTCHQEFKAIQHAKFKKLIPNVEFIAVTDESNEKLKRYINSYQYDYIDFLHTPKYVENIGVHAFPTIYIFNGKGQLIFSKVGLVDWNDKEWIATLKA